jgi:hypothetical protein
VIMWGPHSTAISTCPSVIDAQAFAEPNAEVDPGFALVVLFGLRHAADRFGSPYRDYPGQAMRRTHTGRHLTSCVSRSY